MKIISGLSKSFRHEFDHRQIQRFAKKFFINSKNLPQVPFVREYFMSLDRPRPALSYSPEHQLIQTIIAPILEKNLEKTWAKSLVSYQKGRSVDEIFQDLRIYLKNYKKNIPEKRNRKLTVFRFDIHQYSESIPLHSQSKLWVQLQNAGLQTLLPWIQNELRCCVVQSVEPESGIYTKTKGISFASPMNPSLVNMYLSDFDHQIEKIFPNVFYRRFCDDCLIVGSDAGEVLKIKEWIVAQLYQMELSIHPNKSKMFQWTGSGYESKISFEYLGRSFSFHGLMFLTIPKVEGIFQLWKSTMKKIKSYDEQVLVPTWIEFCKSQPLVELHSWVNDADRVRNLSDRLGQLTRKKFPDIKKIPSFYSIWVKKFR